MFCPKCGNQLPDGANFCGSCGATLAQHAHGASSAPGQPAAHPQGGVSGSTLGTAAATGAVKAGVSGLSKIAIAVIALIALAAAIFVLKPFNGSPEEAYAKAFNRIQESGAWHETAEMKVDLVASGTGEYAINYEMSIGANMDMDVSRYKPDDSSSVVVEGSGVLDMDLGSYYESLGYDQSYLAEIPSSLPFTFVYKNRAMTMDMGEFGKSTQKFDINTLCATPETYEDIWDSATINGNTITFHIDGENMIERMNVLAGSTSQFDLSSLKSIENLQFDDLNYTITMDSFSGDIRSNMSFGVRFEESGQSAYVLYELVDTISKPK